MKKILLTILISIGLLAGLFLLRGFLKEKDEEAALQSRIQYAPMVEKDNPVWLSFKELHPDWDVKMACVEDINDDQKSDIVVIYKPEKKKSECLCVAFISKEDGSFFETPAIPAPQQHQKIRFFNMDHEGFLEILITGDKNGEVGYAIFRLIDGELINLFGEGMEDCC